MPEGFKARIVLYSLMGVFATATLVLTLVLVR